MKRKILFLKVLICLPNFQLYEKKKATHKKNFAFPPRKKKWCPGSTIALQWTKKKISIVGQFEKLSIFSECLCICGEEGSSFRFRRGNVTSSHWFCHFDFTILTDKRSSANVCFCSLQLLLTSNITIADFNMGYCMTGSLERGSHQQNTYQTTHFAVIRRAEFNI